MTSRTRKLATLAVAAASALSIGAAVTHASPLAKDTDDSYKPAGVHVTGTSHKTVFSVGAVTVTCTFSSAGGTTPKTGSGKFAISPLPVFSDGGTKPCTDNLNATDTTKTQGAWTIQLLDAPNDESKKEPNTGDQLSIVVPKDGAIVTNSLGCVITVAPNGPFTVKGKYDDKNTLTVSITGLPIKITGPAVCPTGTTSTFNGTYIFSPGVSDAS